MKEWMNERMKKRKKNRNCQSLVDDAVMNSQPEEATTLNLIAFLL